MTSRTASTATADAPAAGQGSHMWVLTLEKPGRGLTTAHGTVTPPTGATRFDVFRTLLDYVVSQNPQMSSGNCVFFTLELNRL
ncbi:hypothetical protein AB0O42_20140 [Streptomyces sp. NPDC089922]|uniref:hypothetical protein n=1 Tax=Streptomyces sp. NPDC089922 TaxID=3155189 RepID=UPI003413757C